MLTGTDMARLQDIYEIFNPAPSQEDKEAHDKWLQGYFRWCYTDDAEHLKTKILEIGLEGMG